MHNANKRKGRARADDREGMKPGGKADFPCDR